MENVAVFFGGKSVEHDISIITGLQVIKNLNIFKYNVIPVYIGKDNNFFTGELLKSEKFYKNIDFKKLAKVTLIAPSSKLFKISKNKIKELANIDFAILATHGGLGESGELSGLLNICNIKVSTGNIFALSTAMDKQKTKIMLNGLNLPYVPFFSVAKKDRTINFDICKPYFSLNTDADKTPSDQDLIEVLDYPLIVKPSSLGSSIGIKKADNYEEYVKALDYAFNFDDCVLVEKFLEGVCELNCSAVNVDDCIVASEIEEPIKISEFLTFENKYLSPNMASKGVIDSGEGSNKISNGMETLKRKFPANLPEKSKEEVQKITKQIYKHFEFSGVIRIDFFYNRNTEEIFVNEINSIPGSMAYYLWSENFSFGQMLDKVIMQEKSNFKLKQDKQTFFKSSVLNGYIEGNTNMKK